MSKVRPSGRAAKATAVVARSRRKTVEAILGNDPSELSEAGRTFASMALDKIRQNGVLGVRQTELLRRALATVGQSLDWDLMQGSAAERVAAAKEDVAKVADAGAQLLERDLAGVLTSKHNEMELLKKASALIQELATGSGAVYPAEVQYSLTARNGLGGLVTKTETLILADAGEAAQAAAALEKRLENVAKLRDQMIEELKQSQRQVNAMRQDLPGFVDSSGGLLVDLLSAST